MSELNRAAKLSLPRQFLTFSVIGTIGFMVDASVLYVAMTFGGAGFFLGRLISYLVAATTTWYLNRRFTFRDKAGQERIKQWMRFLLVNTGGGIINYGLYSILILSSAFFREWPVAAVALGSIAGLAANFTASKFLVFNR